MLTERLPEMKWLSSSFHLYATIVIAMIVSCSVLFILAGMPVAYSDDQGSELTSALEVEFELPISSRDPRESIWHSPKTYFSLTGWKKGSEVFIYGLMEAHQQDALLLRASQLVADRQLNDVWINFYDRAAELSGSPPVRVERLSASKRRDK